MPEPKTASLWCRNGFFGTVERPESGSITLQLLCPQSGCKRGGVRPYHVFHVTATDSEDKIRPVQSVFRDPAEPRELLESVNAKKGF